MPFLSAPQPLGDYKLIAGSSASDNLDVTGKEAAFGGPGNDTLNGYSPFISGLKQIPILSGGAGNDTYNISSGGFSVVADIGGGDDVINASFVRLSGLSFGVVNGNDLYATDGFTSVLLIDPLGSERHGNKIEKVIFGEGSYTASQLYDHALRSSSFLGYLSYEDLHSRGIIIFNEVMKPTSTRNTYYSSGVINDSLVGDPAVKPPISGPPS